VYIFLCDFKSSTFATFYVKMSEISQRMTKCIRLIKCSVILKQILSKKFTVVELQFK